MRVVILMFLISLSVITITGCGNIKPDAPVIESQELVIPKQPLSTIQVPIKVNLAPYFKETNESIPIKFEGKEQACEGVSYEYKFFRGPVEFEGKGSQLLFDVDGKYALKLNYCPSCTDLFGSSGTCLVPRIFSSCGLDEPLRKIEVGYATKIGLSSKYKLESSTKLRKIKTVTPCLVSVFDYDATSTLKEEITIALQDLEEDIDKEISAVDLRPEIEEAWNILTESIDLEGYGFLNINPSNVSMSKISFLGDTAYFNTNIEASPSILTNKTRKNGVPLPELSNYTNSDGFDIVMDIYTTYDSLSSIISSNIKDTEIVLKGKTIIFDHVEVHGASNHGIHLQVEFSGDKKGTMYLTGTPKFDAEKQSIAFPDLTFDIKTKDALLKSAKWLFNDRITQEIRKASQIELSPYLESLKSMISTNLNSELTDGVFMKGEVEEMNIDFIHPLENQLFIRINSLGKLEINM